MHLRITSWPLLVAVASWAPVTLAEADGPDFYAVTGVAADDVLNLRSGPSPDADKIGEIPHDGRGLQNLGCEGAPTFAEWQAMTPEQRTESGKKRWCRVRFGDLEGWVAGRYLREDSEPSTPEAR
jgi:uncharacterized protein YraI